MPACRLLGNISQGSQGLSSVSLQKSNHTSFMATQNIKGFPGGASGKEPTCQCRRCKRARFDPWVGKTTYRRKWQPTPVFLPGESHGPRDLVVHRVEKSRTRLKRLSTQVEADATSEFMTSQHILWVKKVTKPKSPKGISEEFSTIFN